MKPIVVEIIYGPPSQSELLEAINTHFSKLDTNKIKSTYLEILTLTSILTTHAFFKKLICF